jgi:hypothetical protein
MAVAYSFFDDLRYLLYRIYFLKFFQILYENARFIFSEGHFFISRVKQIKNFFFVYLKIRAFTEKISVFCGHPIEQKLKRMV